MIRSLMVPCPNTGKQADTGFTLTRLSFEVASLEVNAFECGHCGEFHTWSKSDVRWDEDFADFYYSVVMEDEDGVALWLTLNGSWSRVPSQAKIVSERGYDAIREEAEQLRDEYRSSTIHVVLSPVDPTSVNVG